MSGLRIYFVLALQLSVHEVPHSSKNGPACLGIQPRAKSLPAWDDRSDFTRGCIPRAGFIQENRQGFESESYPNQLPHYQPLHDLALAVSNTATFFCMAGSRPPALVIQVGRVDLIKQTRKPETRNPRTEPKNLNCETRNPNHET